MICFRHKFFKRDSGLNAGNVGLSTPFLNCVAERVRLRSSQDAGNDDDRHPPVQSPKPGCFATLRGGFGLCGIPENLLDALKKKAC